MVEPGKAAPPSGELNLHGLSTEDYIRAEALLSVEQKSALATRLATSLNARDANLEDSASAEAILRLIIWNAEPQVIESMAQAAANNPNTPHSLAWALANDDEAAAMPILAVSIALSDEDLVAIVGATESFAKMGAIAVRPAVGGELSRSLALHGDENTAHLLLNNARAVIPDDAYVSIINRHGEHERIQECIINRDVISAAVAERLSSVVGEALAARLSQRHPTAKKAPLAIPPGNMEGLSAGELDALIARMTADKSISAPLLLRKLCIGNFQFFCRALSAMTKTPTYEVFTRILESPEIHLPELWTKASLDPEWLAVNRAAVGALIHIDRNYTKSDPALFRRNVVDRTFATLKAENHEIDNEQKTYLRSMAK